MRHIFVSVSEHDMEQQILDELSEQRIYAQFDRYTLTYTYDGWYRVTEKHDERVLLSWSGRQMYHAIKEFNKLCYAVVGEVNKGD